MEEKQTVRVAKLFFLPVAWFLVSSVSAAAPVGLVARCSEVAQRFLEKTSRQSAGKPKAPKALKTFDELLGAFSRGLIPDLDDPVQRQAFEIYRKVMFGNPHFPYLKASAMADLADLLRKYPGIKKESFRNFGVGFKTKGHPATKEFSAFVNSQIKSAGQIRSNLFQVDANLGFWKKVFGYKGPMSVLISPEEKQRQYTRFMEQRFPPPLRSYLAQKEIPFSEKHRKLYRHLMRERERLKKERKDVRPISQVIVDLIHTAGYHDKDMVFVLKSGEVRERPGAFRRILQARENLARELGYSDFEQVLKDLKVAGPSSLSGIDLGKKLDFLENQIVQNGREYSTHASKTVRHLSLVESPFRGCLGGDDCSSRDYFARALDPSYHYFTLTDGQGHSSGQVTIVLGEAENKASERVKVAFVDKLQNVALENIPLLLEGVRKSVAEKGYQLAVPEFVGTTRTGGISNRMRIRWFVENDIEKDWKEAFLDFRPHPNGYDHFDIKHSRAREGLILRPVLPFVSKNWEMRGTELDSAWKVPHLDLKELVRGAIELKHGGVEEKLRYIASMDAALKARGLSPDSDFPSRLSSWLQDRTQAFKLRKRIFLYRWFDQRKASFPQMLETFEAEERVVLIQNLLDTPRYKERLFGDGMALLALITVRHKPKIKENLIQISFPRHREVVAEVLQAQDISDREALPLLEKIGASFDSHSIEELAGIAVLFRGSSLQAWIEDRLIQNFLPKLSNENTLNRVAADLYSSDALTLNFVDRVIGLALSRENSPLKAFPAFRAWSKIVHFKKEAQTRNLKEAAVLWMKKGIEKDDGRAAELKAQFLMGQIGSGRRSFDHYLELVPESERAAVWQVIDRETSFGLFRDLVREWAISGKVFDRGVLESFQFKRAGFPSGGEDGAVFFRMGEDRMVNVKLTRPVEIQASEVTHLQYALVMGRNPSRFMHGDEVVSLRLGGKSVRIHPNRPVEQVSWEEAQEFITRLNRLQNIHTYRLPTEAEWEFAMQRVSEEEAVASAWWGRNSGGHTHEVAQLPANSFGLHDMRGNVWEWVEDRHGALIPGSVTDPTGPPWGENRVLRGGSFECRQIALLCSLNRTSAPVNTRSKSFGFRLARERR